MKKSIGSFFLSFNLGKDQVSEECQDYSCKVDQLFLPSYILPVGPVSRLEKTRSSCFPSRPRSGTILSELYEKISVLDSVALPERTKKLESSVVPSFQDLN